MNKKIYNSTDVEQKILDAVSKIADPVVQTLSPKGGNVMFMTDTGLAVSNDGVSIARAINVEDKLENSVIKIIRESALRTNAEAGDGTTTSILLTATLIREGLKLKRDGKNGMELTRDLRKASEKIIERLREQIHPVDDDNEILNIARISANNDERIANTVLHAIKVAGVDGMVFLEPSGTLEDKTVDDVGFVLKSGMFRQELRTEGMVASYAKVPVLVTDKRLYYREEVETIFKTIYDAGYKEVVIVARDFIGDALNYLVANHTQGAFKVLLVKDNAATETNYESLEDLATYLGTEVVTDKRGKIVNTLKFSDFAIAQRVFADGIKTVIAADSKVNPALTMRVAELKKLLEDEADDNKKDAYRQRIASMTAGMVTIRVGAATQTELQERVYRFEDSINAARSAMRSGYLVGGGVALLRAYNESDFDEEYKSLFKKYCESSVRQIAINCGKDPKSVIENINGLSEDMEEVKDTVGYDAMYDEYLDLKKQGVIDPADVQLLAVENSVSAACNILSVNYYIINDEEKEKHDERRST